MTGELCGTSDCARPAHDGWRVCDQCAWLLEVALGDVPALAYELDTTLSRQTASGPRNGSRSSTRPLPYDVGASEAGWVLRNTLTTWVRVIEPADDDWPTDELASIARWLLARLWRLQSAEWAPEVTEEVCAAVRAAWRAVDGRAARVFAGECGLVDPETGIACEELLFATVGKAFATCRLCGIGHDVHERRAAMRADLEAKAYTIRDLARLAAYIGDFPDTKRTEDRIKNWARRDEIQPEGKNGEGHAVYLFGPTYERLVERFGRREGEAS